MSSHKTRFLVPSFLLAGLAALALAACGGDSGDSDASALAKFAPADTPVFVEGAVKPDGDVAANLDSITEKLAGVNLGDMIKESINSESGGDVDFEADVEPWLGEKAGAFVQFDPSSLDPTGALGEDLPSLDGAAGPGAAAEEEKFGLVVETTDVDAARTFLDEMAQSDGGSTDGEYEGFSYKVAADDGSTVGIVDDYVLIASTEAEFKAAVDASSGDNLADTDAFSDLSDNVADGALASVFAANDFYAESLMQEGFDLGGLYSALGMETEGTGMVISLVPEANEISLKGYSNAGSEIESGDPSPVIETFPADSIFATGTGDVGSNATTVIDALNEEGIPGLLKPGEVNQFIDEASGQVDVRGIIESLETVAFFVNGTSPQTLGGALVATSSDMEPIENSLRGITSLISLAGDAQVRPLPGDVAGFRVTTPQLPGRPVVLGVKGDRLVIGIGLQAAMTALNGTGTTLAESPAYEAAVESLPDDGIDLFADPVNIAKLVVNASGGSAEAREAANVLRKFQYMAAGSGEGDNSFEFNLGLHE